MLQFSVFSFRFSVFLLATEEPENSERNFYHDGTTLFSAERADDRLSVELFINAINDIVVPVWKLHTPHGCADLAAAHVYGEKIEKSHTGRVYVLQKENHG